MATVPRGTPYLPIGDAAASASYDRRVLGFDVEYSAGDPARFAIRSRDGHGLGFGRQLDAPP